MDFKDTIRQISERIEKLKDNLPNEEATKNALIMPFIQALGYDVFNPLEVLPEMTCDVGAKKGEKIDYAILKDGTPIILIECKHVEQDLNLHETQMLRYFNVSKAKFGVLTNGKTYRFYTDLNSPNVMDEKPFLDINLLELKDSQIEELKKFHKSYFDIDTIINSASELKYMNELKALITKEFSNPEFDFVRYFGKQVYDGLFTAKVAEVFAPLVRRSIASYINDLISDRLKSAIKIEGEAEKAQEQAIQEIEVKPDSRIFTTTEELEGYMIIKSIIRQHIDIKRVQYKDSQSYFAINLDGSSLKWICRLYFNTAENMRIAIPGEDKKEIRFKIESLDEIYNYSEQLIEAAGRYTQNKD